jgi:hypothetical protein
MVATIYHQLFGLRSQMDSIEALVSRVYFEWMTKNYMIRQWSYRIKHTVGYSTRGGQVNDGSTHPKIEETRLVAV